MTLPDKPQSVCFDANLFIDLLQGTGPHGVAASLLHHAEAGHLEIHLSSLCFLEVRGWPKGDFDGDRDRAAYELLTRPCCLEIEVNRSVGLIARRLLAEHPFLENFDAGQIASAVYAESDVFLTRDKRLLRIGRFEGVLIAEPYVPAGLPPVVVQDTLDGLT